MQQAQACYPQESGGILGGSGNTILGVLPIPNQFLYDRTGTFGITQDDLDRADQFLKKHNLEYLGLYHSHPQGAPYPSEQDLSHNQKYLFIIGLKDRHNPELYAWRVENDKVHQENIKVISDAGISVIDINTGQPKLSQNLTKEEMARLSHLIDDMIAGKNPEYQRLSSHGWNASSFSTFA